MTHVPSLLKVSSLTRVTSVKSLLTLSEWVSKSVTSLLERQVTLKIGEKLTNVSVGLTFLFCPNLPNIHGNHLEMGYVHWKITCSRTDICLHIYKRKSKFLLKMLKVLISPGLNKVGNTSSLSRICWTRGGVLQNGTLTPFLIFFFPGGLPSTPSITLEYLKLFWPSGGL